ncbi:MAG: helix-turn-helix transcriptional regulator [Clostridiales bacterium]|nr:helix-turn-helix transcriptional regulator [Clostridiales bacterium]
MKKSIDELYKTNYDVEFLDILRQFWKTTNSFSCLDTPKKQELFLYLDGCDAEYELPNGTKFFAKSGNLVYTALGSQYKVRFSNFKNENSGTVGINFYIFDENRQKISLNKDIVIFNTNEEIVALVDRAESYLRSPIRNTKARFKAILLQIVSELGENSRFFALTREQGYSVVSRALHFLDANVESNISVAKLAKLCNISEVYLRVLFQKFTGLSPSQYRIDQRLKKAEKYLLYGDIPVNEIAELLGFSNTAYFIKVFKKKYGCTPFAYRKNHNR